MTKQAIPAALKLEESLNKYKVDLAKKELPLGPHKKYIISKYLM